MLCTKRAKKSQNKDQGENKIINMDTRQTFLNQK